MSKFKNNKLWIYICAAVIVFAICGFYIQNNRLKTKTEGHLQTLLDLPVSIDSAQLSPISNTAKFKGIQIKNPEGYSGSPMFYIEEVRLSAEDFSARIPVIKKVELRGVTLNAEDNSYGDLNLGEFYDRLMGGLDTASDFEVTLRPNTIHVYKAKLHSDAEVVAFKDKTPLSSIQSFETAPLHEWIKFTFKSYGLEIFSGIAKIKVKHGIDMTKDTTQRLVQDLKIFSESIENTASDFLNLNR